MSFDLYEFKQNKNVRGKEIVDCLAAYYPKFTKAVESYASRPEDSGVCLTSDAAELLKAKFDVERYRHRRKSDGLRQIRCRVTPEFAEKFAAMARREGYTVQELISGFVHEWYETMLTVDELKANGQWFESERE